METAQRSPSVLWLPVVGLAAVQGAITIAWVIYNVYVPSLLKQFNFPAEFAITVLVIENALAIASEPLMGGLSDRQQSWLTNRWPFISFGILSASVLFVAIPSVVIFGSPNNAVMQWLLPLALVLWALSMTIFRSPAMALLGIYAFGTNLPAAASILSVAGGLAGSIRPLANKWILGLGPALTFTIGSLVLLGAAGVLRYTSRTYTPPEIILTDRDRFKQRQILPALGVLFLTGLSLGFGVRLVLGEVLPRVAKVELTGIGIDILMGVVAIGLGIAAVPGGWLASKLGNRLVMLIGLLLTAIGAGFMTVGHGSLAISLVLLVLVLAFGTVLNGTVPLSLELMATNHGGLGVGMYFGGFAAAMSLFNAIFPKSEVLSLATAGILAVIFLIVASGAIAFSSQLVPLQSEKLDLAAK